MASIESIMSDVAPTCEARILKKKSDFYTSTYYIECEPHYRTVLFGMHTGWKSYGSQKLKKAPLLLALPLPYTYYIITAQAGTAIPRNISAAPDRLDPWDKNNLGYILPLPNMGRFGWTCNQHNLCPGVTKEDADPIALVDFYWAMQFNLLETPVESHAELSKWAGVKPVNNLEHPDPDQFEKWAKLSLNDLKDQKWLWSSRIPTTDQNPYRTMYFYD